MQSFYSLHNFIDMMCSWKWRTAWRGQVVSHWSCLPGVCLAPGASQVCSPWAGGCPGHSSHLPASAFPQTFPHLPHRPGAPHLHSACTESPALRDGKRSTWLAAWLCCSCIIPRACHSAVPPVPGKYWIDCTCSDEGCGMKPSSRTDAK